MLSIIAPLRVGRGPATPMTAATKLVLLRHGESVWNKENRFTGWTDVDLSEQGRSEAHEAGRLLREAGFVFDVAYTSVLKRAIRTCWIALDELDQMWIPMPCDWRLNERHYGALQGLNKAETAAQHGEAQTKSGEGVTTFLRHHCRGTTRGTRRTIRATRHSRLVRFPPPSRSRTWSRASFPTGTGRLRQRSHRAVACSSPRTATACARS